MEKNDVQDMNLQFKCPECRKWISSEEYAYGHDCEEEEEEIPVYKMRGV
jgi:hypothetical protein